MTTKTITLWIARLEKFTDRIWYVPLISLLAALDIFILIVPTDGLLVSSVMLRPKRWFSTAVLVSTGSALGALAMGWAIEAYGETFLNLIGVQIGSSEIWVKAESFIDLHGPWAVGVFSAGPFPLQPGVVLAALAGMPLTTLFLATWIGRVAKYILFAWAASHAPKFFEKSFGKIFGVREEIEEIREAEKSASDTQG